MSVSPQDAAAALRDIEDTESRSVTLREYQHAAPHFLIWGIIWAVGYGLSDVFPRNANAVWAVLVPIGLVAGYFVSRGSKPANGLRYGAAALALFAFVAATFFVMAPVGGRQIGAFIPLFVALIYVLRGIWGGLRYIVAGVAIAALTLGGFVFLNSHFSLWMAAVGGGALVLAGLWMRRV
jgi:hypothetical protein